MSRQFAPSLSSNSIDGEHALARPAPFALFDASLGDDSDWSRMLHELQDDIVCRKAEEIAACFQRIETCLADGYHVLGLFDYELGYALHRKLNPLLRTERPLFRALAFRRMERLKRAEIDAWLAEQLATTARPSGVADIHHAVTEGEYLQAIERIRRYIHNGDCYQINYTFRIGFDYFGEPLALYRSMRERQRVSYGAFIALPEQSILSFSPELFVRRAGNTLTAKPMKGTLRRGGDQVEDVFLRESLAEDEKNRAENIMIVDLLRNDLGRLARVGGVRVERLFDVESYRTLLQMTSTIKAETDRPLALREIFAALFPCGSVTGAPKVRCMEIIAEIEKTARGLYTGAIGFIEPNADFCFNVPIRTLVLDNQGQGSLGIGSGIVYDSRPRDEYTECLLKASFVTGLDPGFQLIESMLCDDRGYANLDLHLARLAASARYFGFVCDSDALLEALRRHRAGLLPGRSYKTRLLLAKGGKLELESSLLDPLQDPQFALVATAATDSRDVFLRHKSTVRELYNDQLTKAIDAGCFDALFFNERGELTEGARSNVFLKLDGIWYTPPLACGVLPGVMRQRLLADPSYGASERILRADDFARAEAIVLSNAVRGVVAVTLRQIKVD
jgi:para-aminobenzoate synthetase/4-amino-4-deoxychorismate lyase